MQRDVKIGIAIGVLLIALIAVFWWIRHTRNNANVPAGGQENQVAEEFPPIAPVSPPIGFPTETSTAPGASSPAPMTTVGAPMGTIVLTPPPPPPTAASQTYKVQSGDSLATIAQHFYGSQAKSKRDLIYNFNKTLIGPDPTKLKIGMELKIPDVSGAPSTGTATATSGTGAAGGKYTIQSGDNLTKIAQKMYGSATPADIDRIYQANKTKIGPDPDVLKVGMELVIPAH